MLGKGETENFQILIAHNPVFFQDYGCIVTGERNLCGIGTSSAAESFASPGLGGLITPQAKLFPKYSGELTKEEESYIAVSRAGLGATL